MKTGRLLQIIVALALAAWSLNGQTVEVNREAEETYSRAMRKGLEAYDRGRFEDAVVEFKKAAEVSPGDSEAFNNLGMALVRADRLEEAIASLQEAVRLNPRNAEARFNLGRQYHSGGRVTQAAIELVAAVQVKPEFDEAWKELGAVLVEMHASGINEPLRILSDNPGVAESYFTRGYALYRVGRYDQSIKQLRQAVSLKPQFAGAKHLLGLVYFEKNRKKDAITAMESAIEIDPGYETARYNLALIYLANGSREKAFGQYHSLQSLHSELTRPLLNYLSTNGVVNVRDLLIGK